MSEKWKISNSFNYNRYEYRFKIGDIVKIVITNPYGYWGESFWIEITEANGYTPRVENKNNGFVRDEAFETEFKGRVDNELTTEDYPKLNDIIEFNLGHIVRLFEK